MSAPTTTIALGSIATTYIKYGFYLSITALVLFIILLVVNYTIHPIFSFMPGDGGVIAVPVKTIEQLAFAGVPAPSDVSCKFTNILSANYTMSLDVNISSGFYTTAIPRVLLYRSLTQVAMATTDTTDTLTDRFPTTNLFVWIDPVRNDLHVSAICLDGNNMIHVINSKPVMNVPILTPFRVSVVVTKRFVELYINGELEQTMPLEHPLLNLDATADANYFATPALVRQSVQVANISYWNTILSAKAIRALQGQRPLNKTIFNN